MLFNYAYNYISDISHFPKRCFFTFSSAIFLTFFSPQSLLQTNGCSHLGWTLSPIDAETAQLISLFIIVATANIHKCVFKDPKDSIRPCRVRAFSSFSSAYFQITSAVVSSLVFHPIGINNNIWVFGQIRPLWHRLRFFWWAHFLSAPRSYGWLYWHQTARRGRSRSALGASVSACVCSMCFNHRGFERERNKCHFMEVEWRERQSPPTSAAVWLADAAREELKMDSPAHV